MLHGYETFASIRPINRLIKYRVGINANTIKSIFPGKWKLSKIFKLAYLTYLVMSIDIALPFLPETLEPIFGVDINLRSVLLAIE